jgi:hypothetical protein
MTELVIAKKLDHHMPYYKEHYNLAQQLERCYFVSPGSLLRHVEVYKLYYMIYMNKVVVTTHKELGLVIVTKMWEFMNEGLFLPQFIEGKIVSYAQEADIKLPPRTVGKLKLD